ncbi:MAG: FAD-dependent oxidoreductase [Actinobacteria bacterium]|nr:FAD-dependent oxidoreductase [Actinomycetota bacterium]
MLVAGDRNPRTGRESEGVAEVRLTRAPKSVLIVGAGPAGMQAAIAAARNGHVVTVLEAHAEAGGQVRLAASVPNRAEFGDLVRNQVSECRRLGVRIEYGVWADAAEIRRRNPDRVIIATGARAARPWWAPADADWIVDVRDVLDGTAHPVGDVVVLDELGFHHATSVAELLADRGAAVEVITNGMVVGQDLGITLDMENWWIRANSKGITQTTEMVPMGVDVAPDGTKTVDFQHHPTGQMRRRTPDWVVLAVPADPVEELYLELRDAGVAVERVGDCVAPRRAHAAVVDGERAGAAV